MSIVNDALKKAGKEFEAGDRVQVTPAMERSHSSDKKWVAIITISLFIILSLFGSLAIYKGVSGFNKNYALDQSNRPASAIQSALNSVEQKTASTGMKSKDVLKLNGIVYGRESKWAIVNDRIVKEGDQLIGGEITKITKDIVRIKKPDGNEITLSLK